MTGPKKIDYLLAGAFILAVTLALLGALVSSGFALPR